MRDLPTDEQEHAKRLFKFQEGGDAEVIATFPGWRPTAENLRASVQGENHEQEQMNPQFADLATEEGFPVIAAVFSAIAVTEA